MVAFLFPHLARPADAVYLAAMLRTLNPGDRFPDFVLPRPDGTPTRLYSRVGGRPAMIVLQRGRSKSDFPKSLSEICDVVVISNKAESDPGVSFVDPNGDVIDQYVERDATQIGYVLDANLRVVECVSDLTMDTIRTALSSLMCSDPTHEIRMQAPVLMVDRVLELERCDFLMRLWETDETIETGVETSTGQGREAVVSDRLKSRRDHTVDDQKLTQLLTQSIGKRLLPEIERAFVYRPTRFEGFKIACYDAESSGFFHVHRDNLSPSTEHRRLAVSLNLNDGYVGGQLRFPEFGSDHYCPAAGSALVFSCAHLHEVLPVTSGRRFALLTFLYDEGARRDSIDPFNL